MKQLFTLILITLLLCTTLTQSVLAAENTALSSEHTITITNSGIVVEGTDSIGTPSNSAIDIETNLSSENANNITDSGIVIEGTDSIDTPSNSAIDIETALSSENVNNITDSGIVVEGTDNIDTLSDSAIVLDDENISVTCSTGTALEFQTNSAMQITAPAITATPTSIVLTNFDEPYRIDAVAFPVGTTDEELSRWFSQLVMGFTGYDKTGDSHDLISGEWSFNEVDTSNTSVYYAFTSPELGVEYTLADGVAMPKQLCAVSIQVPGEPDINCCVAGRGFLHFPWVLSSEQENQLDEFQLWLRQDDEAWVSLDDGFLFISDGLQLSQRVLAYGSNYELKVTYPGGQTGILNFKYDGELSIIDYSCGDKDGGDVKGGDSGSNVQPAPTPTTPTDNSNVVANQSEDNESNAPSNSSSEIDDTLENLDYSSVDKKTQLDRHEPLSRGIQLSSYEHKSANSTKIDEKDKKKIDSQFQFPISDHPLNLALAIPAKALVPIFSYDFFSPKPENNSSEGIKEASAETNNVSSEVESTSSEYIKEAKSKPKYRGQAAVKPVISTQNTLSEENIGAQSSDIVTESYSPDKTVISGLRLKDLCKEEEKVVFGSGNLTVSIPSKPLLALNLSDMDTLTVKLKQPKFNQIVFSVESSAKSIKQLSGAILRLQYIQKSNDTTIIIQNDTGKQITEFSYDGQLLKFTADMSGTYTILEQLNTQEKQENTSPLLPISSGLMLTAGCITIFRRRRNG